MLNYKIEKNYKHNDGLRGSFNELAIETFGLNFEPWYQAGFWGEKYIPYSVAIDGAVISNVSVNLIDCQLNGQARHYIQIGTVMTKKAYRQKGYCRMLIETVLRDYASCDGFFLFANADVLDFYPKFGFEKTKEYRFRANVNSAFDNAAQPVFMQTESDFAAFLKEKKQRVSNSLLQLDADGLMMFYLTQFMQDSVYYLKALDAYVIAQTDRDSLVLYDVFSKQPIDMALVCRSFGKSISKVEFAFVPKQTRSLERYEYSQADTTFFVRGNRLLQDMQTISSFPELAHA